MNQKNSVTFLQVKNLKTNEVMNLFGQSLRDNLTASHSSSNKTTGLDNFVYVDRRETLTSETVTFDFVMSKDNDTYLTNFFNSPKAIFEFEFEKNDIRKSVWLSVSNQKKTMQTLNFGTYSINFDKVSKFLKKTSEFNLVPSEYELGVYNQSTYNESLYADYGSDVFFVVFENRGHGKGYINIKGKILSTTIKVKINGDAFDIFNCPIGQYFSYSNIPTEFHLTYATTKNQGRKGTTLMTNIVDLGVPVFELDLDYGDNDIVIVGLGSVGIEMIETYNIP